MRDRLKLWSWALKRKQALQMRHAVLNTVAELKARFKKVLYMYQSWKEEKRQLSNYRRSLPMRKLIKR